MDGRICATCKEKKSLDEFYFDKGRKIYQYVCKVCSSIYHHKRWLKKSPAERARNAKKARIWRVKQRKEILAAYGGHCVCCGDTHKEFLTIDHINGGGTQHRKRLGGGTPFFTWLRKQGFPKEEFRLLCINCNFSMGKYGYCPHTKEVYHQGSSLV